MSVETLLELYIDNVKDFVKQDYLPEHLKQTKKHKGLTNFTLINWIDKQTEELAEKLPDENKKKLQEVKEKAIEKTTPGDIQTTIEQMYSKVIDLENAKHNLLHAGTLASQNAKRNVDLIAECVNEAQNSIQSFFQDVYGILGEKWESFKKLISAFISNLRNKGKEFLLKVREGFKKLMKFFYEIVSEFINTVFGFIDKINSMIKPHNFKINNFDLTFDSPEVETKIILGIPIPTIKLKLPTLLISFAETSEHENDKSSITVAPKTKRVDNLG